MQVLKLHLVTPALIRRSSLHNVSALKDLPRLEIQKLAPSVIDMVTCGHGGESSLADATFLHSRKRSESSSVPT